MWVRDSASDTLFTELNTQATQGLGQDDQDDETKTKSRMGPTQRHLNPGKGLMWFPWYDFWASGGWIFDDCSGQARPLSQKPELIDSSPSEYLHLISCHSNYLHFVQIRAIQSGWIQGESWCALMDGIGWDRLLILMKQVLSRWRLWVHTPPP